MMMSQQQQQQQQKRVATVFRGEVRLGEAEVVPAKTRAFRFPKNEIRISHLTPPSERCNPLAVLQTIAPFAVMCKIRSIATDAEDPLNHLYNSCLRQLSTAVVVLLPSEELHLVPLPSRSSPNLPCFWCFAAPTALYASCLSMLNPRCLAIVFDLDETLFVANTMKSFEDKIDALSNRIDAEDDPARVSGMSAELKRYLEDRALLKQYAENDSVVDSNANLLSFQNEEVPPLTPNHNSFFRPVIRFPDRNIVLTRINPEIRDTSVLVRLRPAWDELRSYVIAKGRKRFEVYVCTMAERDYALEMWRLLDPEAHLINSKQLLDRIVCVKSGSRKSLVNVFQGRSCHPKLAMVIDDRLNVWDEKDQPRLHVVPPFTPYYAPQAEMANLVPVLCVARNVACNVRGGFFREFDENLLRKIGEFHYEDEILDLPFPPEASDYLMSEDPGVVVGNNKDLSVSEGANGAETESRITQSQKGVLIGNERDLTASDRTNGSDIEMKIDQHVSIPEEGGRKLQANNSYLPDEEVPKKHACANTNNNNLQNEEGTSPLVSPSLSVDVLYEIGRKCNAKIEFKTVATSNNDDLQFLVEVLFGSESMEPGSGRMTFSTKKIGAGTGKTRKEAQLQAAANALQHLSNHYVEFIENSNGVRDDCSTKHSLRKDCGFLDEDVTQDFVSSPKKEALNECSSPTIGATDDTQSRLPALVSDIKQFLHANEGRSLVFQDKPPASVSLSKGDYYAQVETAGRVLGKGICSSKEGAKLQAAEDALKALKVSDSQSLKRVPSGRLPQVGSVKRPKEEVARQ